MTGLKLYTSNRLELLANELAELLKGPLHSALTAEVIVVQSRGMERWISMQLARAHGVCANIRYPFPNHFVHELFQMVVPDVPQVSPFEPRNLAWRIMARLPELTARPGFGPLRNYLENSSSLKQFQISERIADLFDQYLIFRPDLVAQWELGKGTHWQAILWRELVAESGNRHRADLAHRFLAETKTRSSPPEGMPERISVFGISALPRFHMDILAGIAHLSRVNLFLLNPCREYWGDIVSPREIRRLSGGGEVRKDLHFETGNSLLSSMGALGRDFFDLISEYDSEQVPLFHDPGGKTLLAAVQSDIATLQDAADPLRVKRGFDPEDDSIQVHCCHSPMREIEVLHDQILSLLEQVPGLEPRDILVMTPDIESYAPYIEAVFDAPRSAELRIPFSIADRSIKQESELIETFLNILDLCNGRFSASQVVNILESPAVRNRFGLEEHDLEQIQHWIQETRICWGIDGESKAASGLPPFNENTWRGGLERLLLGYALPGGGQTLYEGTLPYDQVEGENARVLGRLCHFAELLFDWAGRLGERRTLEQWHGFLNSLLDTFFQPQGDEEGAMLVLRRLTHQLSRMAGGFQEPVDIQVISWYLDRSAREERFGFGFITGGVTFCAMLPMRSIPFKIICLVGMNHDSYPRRSTTLGFDLMSHQPRQGDRSRRLDDRYLFLEALLSAREKLYISYVGRSLQDNSPIPPSVLVNELLDYVAEGFRVPDSSTWERLCTEHPLHPFSPEYFRPDGKLFSYSIEHVETARRQGRHRTPPPPFFETGLGLPEDPEPQLSLADLCRMFVHPTRHLLNRRLEIYLEEEPSVLDEREPFSVTGLDRYLLGDFLLEWRLSGRDPRDALSLARSAGRLPHGTLGECLFREVCDGVDRFAERIAPLVTNGSFRPIDVDLDIGGVNIHGHILCFNSHHHLRYRYARVTPKDRLRAWIHHLAANAMSAPDFSGVTLVVGLEQRGDKKPAWTAFRYPPLDNAAELLGGLLRIYEQGLTRPLHFFPDASWGYAQDTLQKGIPPDRALTRARGVWEGGGFRRGENEDPYHRMCFRHKDPLDNAFQELAGDIFGPVIAHESPVDDPDQLYHPEF